ncbi:hypothetical protein AXA44_30825 [Rhodococcus sp. SC4]|nr:hypothetical protein AXA44_30825 [Rhodococcus sp. SC4]
MPLQIAPKLRQRTAQKWLAALTGHLYPGELVWALARTNAIYPRCDGVAVTNARLLAFLGSDVATSGPRVAVAADDIGRFDILRSGTSTTLLVTTRQNQQLSFGTLQHDDVAFVGHYVHHLTLAGFPPGMRAAVDAQGRAAAEAAAAARRGVADRAAEERAATTPAAAADHPNRPRSGPAAAEPAPPPQQQQNTPEPAVVPDAGTRTTTDQPLKALDTLIARGQSAQHLPQKLRTEIAATVRTAIDDRTAAALREIPASSLKDALPRGTRLGSLGASRFRTVADIAASTPTAIAALPGIGPQSAHAIYTEAVAQRTRARAQIRIRFDPDHRSGIDTSLLRLLLALRSVDPLVGEISAPLNQLRTQVDPLRDPAQRAGKRMAMFFSGKAKRAQARAALQELRAIAADPTLPDLGNHIAMALEAAQGHRDPWPEYEKDAAAVNALLSQFVTTGSGDEERAAHGFIGDQIAKEVERLPLDRTYMRSYLRGYQAFGARYILSRRKVILGDEMGLGKTVQALAVAAHLAAQHERHFLVICPASVLVNWSNETGKHTTLVPHDVHGQDREGRLREWATEGGVAITTFDTLKRIRLPVRPALVIVDEAHYIKNPGTQRAAAARGIVESSGRAVLLSGTPMENRVEEFKNLVRYVQPDVARQIHARDAVAGATAFRKIVAPAYLRRNQIDVLRELPDLIEVEDWVQLCGDDAARYEQAVLEGNFMAMRQAAYRPGTRTGSAKLDRLVEIVEEAEENQAKVLVFSYFRAVLDIIHAAVPGTVFGPLTGATSTAERQRLVDDFTAHHGRAVLLSQIEAGGVGLNIQAASVVVLTEPQWKPSTEVQAIARAHRMGQVRTVQVHRLLAKDSIDELMRRTLAHKSELFDAYARRSHAKESDRAAVDVDWDAGVGPSEADLVRAEQQRLGLG